MPKSKKRVVKKRAVADSRIAFDFAIKIYKKFKDIIKAVVLFGSVAKEQPSAKSDIDIIVFIDDCTVKWDEELIAWYREELGRIIAKEKYKDRMHVNTVTLSTFWDELKAGEPLAINVVRYGEVLIDYGGFFNPLKVLLAKGKLRPSAEAVFVTMERASDHLFRANNSILAAVEGFYWAMVDASHSALMSLNVIPPSPELIADLLNDFFVSQKKLDKKYLDYFVEIRKISKDVRNGDIKQLTGSHLQNLQNKAVDFVGELRKITELIIKNEKIIKVNEKKI